MGYRLVITEKPSVAAAIATVIGAKEQKDGFFEGGGYLVSWCVGHLVELAMPEDYDERYKKWVQADLPIIPDKWHYQVSASTRKQFQVLKKLMERNDVESLIESTDAGREGELIFRLVYHQAGCKKPFERLWISSMEDSAIKEGFAGLKTSAEYDSLYNVALCRDRADWIVGINTTRLYSCLYGSTLNVGRVMTPTLAMLVEREKSIADFVPELFYTVQLTVDGFHVSSKRFKERGEAESLLKSCLEDGTVTVSKVDTKDKTEKPPLLYDLTSLQRDANKLLGYSAQKTLDDLQSLYEKKLVTYPRTDSRYLTDDMASMIPKLSKTVSAAINYPGACPVNAKQVINSSKVTDHHAVIPTKEIRRCNEVSLSAGEKAILELVAVRFLSAIVEACSYRETAVTLSCAGETFTVKGKVILNPGWKTIWQQFYPSKEKDAEDLPCVNSGETYPLSHAEVKDGKTKPAQHFTEGSLLHAMETAGADEIPDDAERKGLGTPATRAGIIEKLIQKGFVQRSGDKKTKVLLPTEKGTSLIAVMPQKLKSPMMTAEWEQKLLEMERGGYAPDRFMSEIGAFIQELVETEKKDTAIQGLARGGRTLGKCPVCGADVTERSRSYSCSNQNCRFALWKDNRYFQSIGKELTAGTAEKLLSGQKVKLKNCTSRKTGKNFDALISMMVDQDGKTSFSMEFERKGGKKK